MEAFIRDLANRYNLQVRVTSRIGYISLDEIVVPEHLYGQGIGTCFMNKVCKEADRRGKILGVIPEPLVPDWTEDDKTRLVEWYERFGFVENLDKKKYRVSYVRMPSIQPLVPTKG